MIFFFFFFFQAEDGIRDKLVTGVQTCALPIYHRDLGVDVQKRAAGACNLGDADVGGAMDDLALQVGEIDLIVVDHAQSADAGGSEILQEWCAEPARTDHQHARGDQPRLAHAADLRQHDVARVAADLRLGEFGQRRHGPLIAWDRVTNAVTTNPMTTTTKPMTTTAVRPTLTPL